MYGGSTYFRGPNTIIVNISLLKYFRTARLVRKLNARKCKHNINDIAVQGRLSENYSMRKIIARNIVYTNDLQHYMTEASTIQNSEVAALLIVCKSMEMVFQTRQSSAL